MSDGIKNKALSAAAKALVCVAAFLHHRDDGDDAAIRAQFKKALDAARRAEEAARGAECDDEWVANDVAEVFCGQVKILGGA